ncbi:hypothetical protein CFU_1293 [Collimonas fungivorans Ter331]|uniref:Uncharacterized protein n=1 Tax=Collimonas fungivorans (strain Ter331) TaxID=1005048 RepID=G0AJJ1_COLFT|nr:hypothetical protein CFU_1293 [Collimonas fungivorans Ter331]
MHYDQKISLVGPKKVVKLSKHGILASWSSLF